MSTLPLASRVETRPLRGIVTLAVRGQALLAVS